MRISGPTSGGAVYPVRTHHPEPTMDPWQTLPLSEAPAALRRNSYLSG